MANKLTVPEVILNLFKSSFGDTFRYYRVGDPIQIGQSQLPAIFISDSNVAVKQDATGYDELQHSILIQVIYNKKDEMGRPVEGNTIDTIMDNIVFGRDATTGAYSTNSLLGILRKNLTLGALSIDSNVVVRKGVVPRPEQMVTAEAHVEIQVTELQPVNDRV